MSKPPHPFPRYLTTGIIVIGLAFSFWTYFLLRDSELRQIQTEFIRRADVRHSLVRDRALRYESGLDAIKIHFEAPGTVDRDEFQWIASEIRDRNPGLTSLAWVSIIPAAERAAREADLSRAVGHPIEFTEYGSGDHWPRAQDRAEIWSIFYMEPQPKPPFYHPLGLAVRSGPARAAFELASTQHSMVLSEAFDFGGSASGCVMIWPIYDKDTPAAIGRLDGFITGALRIDDFLRGFDEYYPTVSTDSLYIDQDSAGKKNRVLYYRHGFTPTPPAEWPEEAVFRQGFVRENSFVFGGRHWRTIYKPAPGWIDTQRTYGPLRGLAIGLIITVLGAFLVETMRRRNTTIQTEVNKRTGELIESRRQMDSLLQSLPGMAYRCRYDDALSIVYVSEGIRSLTGHAPEEFISGRQQFRDFIHPDDLSRVRDATVSALDEGRGFEIEYRVCPDDGAEKWVLSRGTGIRDATGQTDLFEGLAIDITAQKKADHERIVLERKLLDGQKLESLGTLAGGIAHDFNNLLTGILGNASLTRLSLPADSPLIPNLDVIESSSIRAAELCRQMLAYAGKGRFAVDPVDLSTLVSSLAPLLQVSIGRKAGLRLVLSPSAPSVLVDPTQLRQIVMNLVNNAADATDDPKRDIVISTGVMHADLAMLSACVTGAELAPGEYVFLEVRDQGGGIEPALIAKIFDPFYSTKFAGRGLGLAAVLGIVRGHHGALHVTSLPGQGSAFRLLLAPVSAGSAAPALAPKVSASGLTLVIDDEEPVRVVTTKILGLLGFTARVAPNGSAGLAQFCQDPEAFSLVVLDLIMPGLSGEETLVALRKVRPDVPVLLISGYNEGDLLRRLASPHGALSFLAKPFNAETLGQKLRSMLA